MFAYVNGTFLPQDEATVSVRDRGFTLGDGVFDGWRTYGGQSVAKIVARHLRRLQQSLNFIELDGKALSAEIQDAAAELVDRNRAAIREAGDVWVHSTVTRGVGDEEELETSSPTRVILCIPIPFEEMFGEAHVKGARLVPSMMPQNPYLPVDPRVKSISRLALVRAERKQARSEPGTWVITFDNEGFVTEATTASLCVVHDGTVIRAPRWKILGSVSLEVFCELATTLGIAVEERPLTLYDYLNADEVYVLSTSVCALQVGEIDGIPVRRGKDVGPRIIRAWTEYVGFDFVEQARGRSQQSAPTATPTRSATAATTG
jgi:branched-chain amino acid aminotransferase